MSDNSVPSEPPPAYGSVEAGGTAPCPQPGQPSATSPPITEPPPRYEAPKEGSYAPQPPCPPQGQYPAQRQYPPQGYQSNNVPVRQTVIVSSATFGPNPAMIECPNCHNEITTVVTYTSGGLTWLTSGLLCLFGCWAGCCLIPFCIPDLMDAEHRCPNCGRHIGTFTRL